MNKIMLAKALTQISTGFGIFAEAFTTLAASVVDNNETTKEEKATVGQRNNMSKLTKNMLKGFFISASHS